MRYFDNYLDQVYGSIQDKTYDYFIEQFVNGAGRHNNLWVAKPTEIDFTWSDGSVVKTIAIFKIRIKK